MIDFSKLYTALLQPGQPEKGMGYYEHGTGNLKFYSDGGEWFFELGTGRPAFRLVDDHVYVADDFK